MTRPLRLGAREAVALVAALRALDAALGDALDPERAAVLRSALAKLTAATGDAAAAVDVQLAVDAAPEVAAAVATALRHGRRLHLRYVNASDVDHRARRRPDPAGHRRRALLPARLVPAGRRRAAVPRRPRARGDASSTRRAWTTRCATGADVFAPERRGRAGHAAPDQPGALGRRDDAGRRRPQPRRRLVRGRPAGRAARVAAAPGAAGRRRRARRPAARASPQEVAAAARAALRAYGGGGLTCSGSRSGRSWCSRPSPARSCSGGGCGGRRVALGRELSRAAEVAAQLADRVDELQAAAAARRDTGPDALRRPRASCATGCAELRVAAAGRRVAREERADRHPAALGGVLALTGSRPIPRWRG